MEQSYTLHRTAGGSSLPQLLAAVDLWLAYGQSFEKISLKSEAGMYYRSALKMLEDLPSEPSVLERQERAHGLLGRILYSQLFVEAAIPHLEEHCRIHEHLFGGNSVALLEAYLRLCEAYSLNKRFSEACSTAKKAAAITGNLGGYCSAYCIFAHFWVSVFEHELGNLKAAKSAGAAAMTMIGAHPEMLSRGEREMITGLVAGM